MDEKYVIERLNNAKELYDLAICELDIKNRIGDTRRAIDITHEKELDELELLVKPCENNIRVASESMWGAAVSAFDALYNYETNNELHFSKRNKNVREFKKTNTITINAHTHYFKQKKLLHVDCFYNGDCKWAKEELEKGKYIRKLTNEYFNWIRDKIKLKNPQLELPVFKINTFF